jgi:hypothetical protein
MRRTVVLASACAALAACGGSGGGVDAAATIDAQGTVVDGVLVFVDAPLPDAVSATTGAIMLTIQCGGSGCGKTGNLKLALDDCNGGATIASKTQPGKSLTAGVDLHATFDTLDPAMYCATGYLDADSSFSLTTGDVVASGGAAHATVVAGQIATATIVLDTIQP